MDKYDYTKYYGAIVKGDLHGAVDYLNKYPFKRMLVKRYMEVFEEGRNIKRSDNDTINYIDYVFQEYYRRIFWKCEDKNDAVKYLCDEFCNYFGINEISFKNEKDVQDFWDDEIEVRLKEAVEKEGYNYMGGDTQGWLGPYIWKKTVPNTYRVVLPDGVTDFTVNMMTGFVSRSWMAFISFDKIGPGGWADEDGTICCVKKCYFKKMLGSGFRVDFLKHEAQHAVDMKKYPGISSVDLEYRAKLVQLVYAKNMKAFRGFLSEADASNKYNSHSFASYLIIRNLSRVIFNKEFVSDIMMWKERKREISIAAENLFKKYPQFSEL